MKISVLQENLAKGLSIVSRAVSTRSTLPVLANVLVSTDNGRLKLSATNLEIVVTCWINAKVDQEGAITVPSRTFSDLVNSLPQQTVDLSLDESTHTMHMQCARTEANLRGIAADEFPLIPEPDLEQGIQVRAGAFKQMINQVSFSAATDDTRPTLTGVSMQFTPGRLKMAATDAFRLSVREADIPDYTGDAMSIIVPARALSEVARAVSDDEEVLHITLPEGRNQIMFVLSNVVVVSQLIEGNFPDFSPIIPAKYTTKSIMDTASFLKACRTASIFAREASHTARVKFQPGDDGMSGSAIISANSAEMGNNEAQVDASVEGGAVEVAFNVKYLTDVLSVIDAPQVAIETTTAMEPGVVRPVGELEFFHIIMPMHFGR